MPDLRVIAAAVLRDGELLLVSKKAAPAIHYLPGGKPEPHEAPLDCLAREIREELGGGVTDARLFAEVHAPAALEGVAMHMTVYLARLNGTPTPAAEIASLVWWPTTEVSLAPAVQSHVIPELRSQQLLIGHPRKRASRHLH